MTVQAPHPPSAHPNFVPQSRTEDVKVINETFSQRLQYSPAFPLSDFVITQKENELNEIRLKT